MHEEHFTNSVYSAQVCWKPPKIAPYSSVGSILTECQADPLPDKRIMLAVVLISVNLTKYAPIEILSQRSKLEKSLVN